MLKNSAPAGSPPFILESAGVINKDTEYRIVSLSSSLPATIAAQDSLSLEVCFAPLDSTFFPDSLVVRTDCYSFAVALDGQGLTGLISASDLDFGSVNAGDTVCKNVLIKNIGSAPFLLGRSFILSDTIIFSVDESKLPISIPPGGSISIEVCFHPRSEGPYRAVIEWSTDLAASFAHSIKSNSILSGTGTSNAGVKTPLEPNSFLVRPNPTRNELDMYFQQDAGQNTRIEIFDAIGKTVFSEQRNLLSGMNIIHIDTRNLAAGIYLIRIGESSQNFIKE